MRHKKTIKSTCVSVIIILLFLPGFAGCSLLPSQKENEVLLSDLTAGAIFLGGEDVKRQTMALISNATRAIFIEQYIFNDQELIDLLVQRSKDGLEIHILLDQFQRANRATLDTLKNQNISVQYYPAQKGQEQRTRYMSVDYQTAMVFSSDWSENGFALNNMAILLTGKTAFSIAKHFSGDWLSTTTLSLVLPENLSLPEDHITFSYGVGVRNRVLRQIQNAEKEILIMADLVSYEAAQGLIEAKNRGCDVKLIVNPSAAQIVPEAMTNYREAGIEVRYFHEDQDLLGYNIGLFDGKSMLFVSAAWSRSTFITNHECVLIIPSPAVVEKMNSVFFEHWEN